MRTTIIIKAFLIGTVLSVAAGLVIAGIVWFLQWRSLRSNRPEGECAMKVSRAAAVPWPFDRYFRVAWYSEWRRSFVAGNISERWVFPVVPMCLPRLRDRSA